MKKSIKILLLLFIIINTSCREKEVQPIIQEPNNVVNSPKQLTINFNFKTNQADVFKIMMNNIEIDEFQKKNIHIIEEVVPSTGKDVIVAEFDAGNMSKNIVFHLGNKVIKEVEIKSILITYGNNQYNIVNEADINKYLAFNKFVERDSLSKTFKTIRVDGKLNPSFRIKNNLINLLKRE